MKVVETQKDPQTYQGKNTESQGENFESNREKQLITCKGTPIRQIAGFLSETWMLKAAGRQIQSPN